MVDSKQDRLAKQVVELSISFKMALSNKRKYPMAEFKSFVAAAKRYVEALGKDPLIHRDVAVRSADFGSSSRLNVSEWQGKFSTKLIGWNVSFLLAMIHISRGTSRRTSSVKPILLEATSTINRLHANSVLFREVSRELLDFFGAVLSTIDIGFQLFETERYKYNANAN